MKRAVLQWNSTINGLASVPNAQRDEMYHRLEQLYQAPARRYHTIGHVLTCITLLDEFQAETALLSVLEVRFLKLAIWFHDAVYESQQEDNESRSAELAVQWCAEIGLSLPLQSTVHRLILATAHFQTRDALQPSDQRAVHIIQDIDLSILGAAPAQFAWYDWAVRQEYRHLSDREFESGRQRVCSYFLAQPALYHTRWFARRFERQARGNLGARLAGTPARDHDAYR